MSAPDTRYKNTVIMAHVGWWGTALIAGVRAADWIPIQYGTLALLTLGVGVTASLSLSRMRLGDTISQVFNAGMKAAITLSANVFTDTCILALSEDGLIRSVDHCDAIGWTEPQLIGKRINDLLVPRSGMSGVIRKLEPGSSITSPMRNQEGKVFDARVSLAILNQGVDPEGGPDSQDRTLIATISPVVASNDSYELLN